MLAVAISVAGCGEGDDSTAASRPQLSAASEPPNVFAKRLAKLLETSTAKRDCPQLEQINLRSIVRFDCPTGKVVRESMKSFRVVGVKEYGTGAVVDYKSGKAADGAAILLFTGRDRNWGISRFGIVTEPSTGTSDEDSRDGYEASVNDLVAALRRNDCNAAKEAALVEGKDSSCKALYGRMPQLRRQVRTHRGVTAKYRGGNDTYGFFNLETAKPDENTTISVIKADDDRYLVLDATPSPTTLQQKELIEQAREQQRQKLKEKREKEKKQRERQEQQQKKTQS